MRRSVGLLWFAPLLALGAARHATAEEAVTSSSPVPQGRVVYEATPPPAYGTDGGPPPATILAPPAVGRAVIAPPAAAGPSVEIISGGGGGSPGAARVGRMPVLQ
jgi:hypothetical protein